MIRFNIIIMRLRKISVQPRKNQIVNKIAENEVRLNRFAIQWFLCAFLHLCIITKVCIEYTGIERDKMTCPRKLT